MKTIYIDPETWGPDYLWHPSILVDWDEETETERPAMCCLGFACHQLGIPLDLLDSVGLPSHLLEQHSNKLLSKLPKEVKTFIDRCQCTVSEDFAESALKLIGPPSSGNYITWAYEGLLSRVNDWYHGLNDEDKPSKLEPTLEALKLGFKEMGYELVYGKPQTTED